MDAKLRGKQYRVVTTHLESFNLDIQTAQALELVNGPVVSDLPVVLAGDLNSDADNPDPAQSPAYHILVDAGFVDLWSTIHPKRTDQPLAPLHVDSHGWMLLLIGTVISFIVSLGVIAWFMSWVRKRGFTPFAIYRIIIGIAVLLWVKYGH